MKKSTPLTDKFDGETLLGDITKHPHREWRKAVAFARELEVAGRHERKQHRETQKKLRLAQIEISNLETDRRQAQSESLRHWKRLQELEP